jgi:iron complex outermembrane recepter protein
VRMRWSPGDRSTAWAAVSRAVRLPTRIDTTLRLFDPATGALTLAGSDRFDSETVVAYEGGYRVRPHARVALDVAAFANRYDDLRSQEFPSDLGRVVLLGNSLNAVTSGVEVAGTVQVLPAWRVHGWYSYLHKSFSRDAGSRDISGGRSEGNDPAYLISARSSVDLPHGFALDGVFRRAGARPFPAIPAYSELDLRLGWTIRSGWEVSLAGQNLLHDRHQELDASPILRYAFQRGVYLRSAWRF